MLAATDMFSQEHRTDTRILGQCPYPWLSTMIFFFFLSLHVLYQPKSQEIEEWVRYVNWLGWTGVGKREARQRQKKPLCQPLLGTLRDCMAEDQAHYMGTFFSYGKMYENLKGQAVC